MGCTGFFIDPALLGRQYSATFVRCSRHHRHKFKLSAQSWAAQSNNAWYKIYQCHDQNAFGQWYSKYDVLSFHPILNLVFLKVIKMEGDQSTFASVESDKPTNIKINLDPSQSTNRFKFPFVFQVRLLKTMFCHQSLAKQWTIKLKAEI